MQDAALMSLAMQDAVLMSPALMSRTFLFKGRHGRATDDFNEAIRLDPAYADTFMRRGFLYEKLGRRDAMLKEFVSAYSLGNRDPILLRKLKEIDALPR